MKNYTDKEIALLQNNLSFIRRAGGWSAEEFGNMIGVTKQTISNLENKKTPMSKTQYIAIRAVLDYEMEERSDDKAFISTVNLCLNNEGLSAKDKKKATAFVEGATKTGLDNATLIAGLTALVGIAVVEALVKPQTDLSVANAGSWISRILGDKK